MSESLWGRKFMCEAWEPLTQTPSGPTLHFYSTGLSKFTLGGVILHLTSSIINRKQLRSWRPSIFTGTSQYIYWNANPEAPAGIVLARWCVFLGVGLTCVRKDVLPGELGQIPSPPVSKRNLTLLSMLFARADVFEYEYEYECEYECEYEYGEYEHGDL